MRMLIATIDLQLADQLAERNIKWLRSRRIALAASAWIYYYQMIIAIIQLRVTDEPIRSSLLEHFRSDLHNEHPEFFLLLEPEFMESE